MKKLFLFLFLVMTAAQINALNLITVTITVTNTAGTTNGQTLTVNSDTRTWTNSVIVPGSQILTNNLIGGAATNLFVQISQYPFSGLSLAHSGTNGITLQTAPGGPLSVSLSAGWGTAVLTTNTLTSAIVVRIPTSVEAAAVQTNVNSGLMAGIRDPSDTNQFYESDFQMANMMGRTNNQSISGNKSFTGTSNYIAGGYIDTPILTNGVNYGNAFSSKGSNPLPGEQFGAGANASGSQSDAFGLGATASGAVSAAFGTSALASGPGATSLGHFATASGTNSLALGNSAGATSNNAVALGAFSAATGTNSSALGVSTSAAHSNSTAIGYGAVTTAPNQIALGGAGIYTLIQNQLQVLGGITNLLVTQGTNSFSAGADISFTRYALTTLANGDNTDIVVGTNVFVEVSGPSAAFTIHGIAGGRDGKLILILNRTGQSMTLANESGFDGTSANRILTSSAGSRSTSGNGAALLIYNASSSRWILVAFDAASSGAGGSPWLITGNQGGISSANFIGTTDTTPFSLREDTTAVTLYDGNSANLIVNSAQGTVFFPNMLNGGTANSGCSILGGNANVMGGGGSQGSSTIANGDNNSISNSYDSFIAGQSILMDTKARTGSISLRPSIGLGYNWTVQDAGVFVFGDKQQPVASLRTTWIDDAAYFRAQHGIYQITGGLNVGWTNMPDPGAIIGTNWIQIGSSNRIGSTNVVEFNTPGGQAFMIKQSNGYVTIPQALVAPQTWIPTNALSTWPTVPITAGDAVVVNSNGWVYCLCSKSGSLTWSKTNLLATP